MPSIFILVFIESIGLSIIFPLTNPLFFDPVSGLLGPEIGETTRHIWYGITITSYAFLMFIGCPVLSDLSDRWGRKPVLAICLLGTAAGALISAYGIFQHNIYYMVLGRMLDGFTAASLSVSRAAIVDVCKPEMRNTYFGYFAACSGLGYLFGPLLSCLLYEEINIIAPSFGLALLALINFCILVSFFKETHLFNESDKKIKLAAVYDLFHQAYIEKNVFHVAAANFLFAFGVSTFLYFLPMLLHHKVHYTSTGIAWTFALITLVLMLSSLCDRFLSKNIRDKSRFIGSLLMAAVCIFVMLQSQAALPLIFWLLATIPCFALAFIAINTIFSKQVSPDREGWVMGINSSSNALSYAVSGLTAGLLSAIQLELPFILAVLCLCGSCVIIYRVKLLEY